MALRSYQGMQSVLRRRGLFPFVRLSAAPPRYTPLKQLPVRALSAETPEYRRLSAATPPESVPKPKRIFQGCRLVRPHEAFRLTGARQTKCLRSREAPGSRLSPLRAPARRKQRETKSKPPPGSPSNRACHTPAFSLVFCCLQKPFA